MPTTLVDLSPLLQVLFTTVGTIAVAFATFAIHKVNTWLASKTGQQNLLNEDVIRQYLDSALNNAVHFAVSQVGSSDWTHVDTKNALLKAGADYILSHVPDAVKYFKLDPASLESALEAKLNQVLPMTSPAPTTVVVPTH